MKYKYVLHKKLTLIIFIHTISQRIFITLKTNSPTTQWVTCVVAQKIIPRNTENTTFARRVIVTIAENTIRFYKVAFTDTVSCVPIRADIYSISKVVAKCFLWNSSALLGTLCSISITRTLGCDAKLDCQACSFA